MKQKQKRTHIIGALIFVALVTIAGFGLVATGNFHNPLNIFGGDGDHPGGPGAPISQTTSNNAARGQGFTHDRQGPGGGPDAPNSGNNNGIAWNQIGGVFFDLWVLSAIVAGYILVQQMLALIINRFWTRAPRPIT